MTRIRNLLAIVEQGGYPNFTKLYQSCGYQVSIEYTMRKALSTVRKTTPDTIVAEFNYQSDFRDRTSSLESLLATVERITHNGNIKIKVIVFYETQYAFQLEKLQSMFDNFDVIPYPVDESVLKSKIGCDHQ